MIPQFKLISTICQTNNLLYDEKFDLIFTEMILDCIAYTRDILNKFYKLFKPGGTLCMAESRDPVLTLVQSC